MASGRFIPFAQYNQDLTRTMSGLCQIYPSRHITVTIGSTNVDTLVSNADKEADKIRNGATVATGINYGEIRSKLYEAINTKVQYPDSRTAEGAPAMGEINFISHELQGGWMYNDIYVHVTPDEGKKTIIMQPSGFSVNPKRTGLDYAVETKEYRQYDSTRKNLKFDAIILYYNLYMIDPTSHTADTEPVVVDMPLGIYVLGSPATVQINNDAVYGAGAAWSTRIVSRIATKSTIAAVSTDRNQEYATLARVLSEFGDIAETMDTIIHSRDGIATKSRSTRTTDSLALNPEDIKAYLEEFRRLSAVNVPYIKDNHWFVNGRDLGPVSGEVNWVSVFTEYLQNAPASAIEMLRGPQGEPGKDGEKGADGAKGKDGSNGQNGAQGVPGPQGPQGPKPVVTLSSEGYLIVDGEKQLPCLIGKQGDPGKDGEPGKTPILDVVEIKDKDGVPHAYLTVDGQPTGTDLLGPQGPVGPQGADGNGIDGAPGKDGNDGKDGKDGRTPEISVSDDGYLVVDGEKQTNVRLIGPAGKDGKDGRDGLDGAPGSAGVGTAGKDGKDGKTPVITATASVNANTGTPKVTVTKSGTDENPSFAFAFENLKGKDGISPEIIYPVSIDGSISPATLSIGETAQATATVLPEDTTDKHIVYFSHNDTIATCDAMGKVKAVSGGDVTITAVAAGNINLRKDLHLTIQHQAIHEMKWQTSAGDVINNLGLEIPKFQNIDGSTLSMPMYRVDGSSSIKINFLNDTILGDTRTGRNSTVSCDDSSKVSNLKVETREDGGLRISWDPIDSKRLLTYTLTVKDVADGQSISIKIMQVSAAQVVTPAFDYANLKISWPDGEDLDFALGPINLKGMPGKNGHNITGFNTTSKGGNLISSSYLGFGGGNSFGSTTGAFTANKFGEWTADSLEAGPSYEGAFLNFVRESDEISKDDAGFLFNEGLEWMIENLADGIIEMPLLIHYAVGRPGTSFDVEFELWKGGTMIRHMLTDRSGYYEGTGTNVYNQTITFNTIPSMDTSFVKVATLYYNIWDGSCIIEREEY